MNTEHNRDHLDLIVGVITVVYVGGIHIVIESNQVIRVMLLITMLFKYVLRSHSIRCSVSPNAVALHNSAHNTKEAH